MEQYRDQNHPPQQPKRNPFVLPIAIIVAGALIAGALFYRGEAVSNPTAEIDEYIYELNSAEVVRPVGVTDHIIGNPNAPLVVVEYSDYECPYCKIFHETMHRIMDIHGAGGQIAWVYRHLPVEDVHPNAKRIAMASECVAELGGNDAFWTFSDQIFRHRTGEEFTDMSRLEEFAADATVDTTLFTQCLASNKYQKQIDDAYTEAIAAGGHNGTPHTIILIGDQRAVIDGAQPFEVVHQIISNLIAQLEGARIPSG